MHNGLQEICDYRVLFLDMNSFFASVEQQYNPSFRNKPTAAVSHHGDKGTVLAASYEAKAFGVQTGMKIRDALVLCPELLMAETDHVRYRAIHERFMAILKDVCGPETVAYSIDEAAVQLSANWRTEEKAIEIALRIKERFRKELGECIRCSIGIAPNTFLAKVASNLKKPDGLTVITATELPRRLGAMELTDLPGIARRTATSLAMHDIFTPLDIYNSSPASLRTHMGIAGQYWWWKLHGYEPQADHAKGHKAISHQHVLQKWLSSTEAVQPVVMKMADRLIGRLRRNGYQCQTVWLYLRTDKGSGVSAQRRFDSPAGGYLQLLRTIESLLTSFPVRPGAIRAVVIGFSEISDASRGLQLDMFEDAPRDDRLNDAVQLIRGRHGQNAIRLGNVVALKSGVAKEQLGFGRLKDRAVSGA